MTEFFPGFAVDDEKGFGSIEPPGGKGVSSIYIPGGEDWVRFDMNVETPTGDKGISLTDTLVSNDGAPVLLSDEENPASQGGVEIQQARWDAFAFRVRQFLSGLSPRRRAEIARRIRFYTLPWIRLTTEPDDDDLPL